MKMGTRSNSKPVLFERLAQFLGEVGRRRVWRTAFAYAAVVFVVLQLGEIIFPAFGAPDWALRLLVMACILGFPVVLALAWAFDITLDGIQRTQPGEGSFSRSDYSGTTLPRLSLLAVIVATVGGVGWWTVQDTLLAQTPNPSGSTDEFVTAAALEDPPLQVRSLAVLPLDDFSEEEGGEYFTAGLHEELVSQLSQIGAARVLSRTSVVQYDATGKTMPLIAADLGVEGVVEGSVFRDGNRVRITVQLIHGPTDQHLWANSYDGTLEDAIGLQRRVAQAIAKEIQAELFPEEQWETPENRVAATPRVQEEYMKGRYDQSKATPEALESAIGHPPLEVDIALTATEFGRQLHRIVVQQGREAPDRLSASQNQRLANARRLQASSDFKTAEELVRATIEEWPESAEAWDVLERLKTTQKDRNLISLWTDPAWDSVRTDPSFREILSKARRGSGQDGIQPQ